MGASKLLRNYHNRWFSHLSISAFRQYPSHKFRTAKGHIFFTFLFKPFHRMEILIAAFIYCATSPNLWTDEIMVIMVHVNPIEFNIPSANTAHCTSLHRQYIQWAKWILYNRNAFSRILTFCFGHFYMRNSDWIWEFSSHSMQDASFNGQMCLYGKDITYYLK